MKLVRTEALLVPLVAALLAGCGDVLTPADVAGLYRLPEGSYLWAVYPLAIELRADMSCTLSLDEGRLPEDLRMEEPGGQELFPLYHGFWRMDGRTVTVEPRYERDLPRDQGGPVWWPDPDGTMRWVQPAHDVPEPKEWFFWGWRLQALWGEGAKAGLYLLRTPAQADETPAR